MSSSIMSVPSHLQTKLTLKRTFQFNSLLHKIMFWPRKNLCIVQFKSEISEICPKCHLQHLHTLSVDIYSKNHISQTNLHFLQKKQLALSHLCKNKQIQFCVLYISMCSFFGILLTFIDTVQGESRSFLTNNALLFNKDPLCTNTHMIISCRQNLKQI